MSFLESLIFITILIFWVVMMFTIGEIIVVTDYLNEFKRKKDINRVREYEARLVKTKRALWIVLSVITINIIILVSSLSLII